MNGNEGKGRLISGETGISRRTETNAGADICSYCGSTVEMDEWHPVTTDDDGSGFRIHAFCDDGCRRLWEE